MTKPTNSLLHRIDYPKKNAPKLVLLHGLGGTHRYWHTGLEQLQQQYHLILVDLLGFGDSAKPWQIYTREKHLNALEDCLADITNFSIMGHSQISGIQLFHIPIEELLFAFTFGAMWGSFTSISIG